MKNMSRSRFAIDNASILFLAQFRRDHTNTFRFTMTLTEPISPDILQTAVNNTYRRFPTIIASFKPGIFAYFQVPVEAPPKVQPDPGCLITMTKEELYRCAYRVFYAGNTVSIEAFHALTDGYGAIASFTTLVAEYLRLKNGAQIPVSGTLLDIHQIPQTHEVEDSFQKYQSNNPKRLPSRYAYQLPGGKDKRESILTSSYKVSTVGLLDAAHRYGVSLNTLISSVMAASVMEIQQMKSNSKLQPVRIMVPVNLRRLFPSRTLRNFSYYVLPTMEPEDSEKPLSALITSFSDQIHTQTRQDQMQNVISNNVKLQNAWFFRIIPLPVKFALMRLVCRFFGERTSSITVTNLGNVSLPEEMRSFITHMDVTLTPRMLSPYGCTVLSYNGTLTINLSRFPQQSELDDVFFQNLNKVLCSED